MNNFKLFYLTSIAFFKDKIISLRKIYSHIAEWNSSISL